MDLRDLLAVSVEAAVLGGLEVKQKNHVYAAQWANIEKAHVPLSIPLFFRSLFHTRTDAAKPRGNADAAYVYYNVCNTSLVHTSPR